MKKTACLLAFLALFAESGAKEIKVLFKGVEMNEEHFEKYREVSGKADIPKASLLGPFNGNIRSGLDGLECRAVLESGNEKYTVTARLTFDGITQQSTMILRAEGNGVTLSSPVDRHNLLSEEEEFQVIVRKAAASLCEKIQERENKPGIGEHFLPFAPFGVAHFIKRETGSGFTIMILEAGTLLAGGFFAVKSKSNFDEAEKVKKRINSGVAENAAEHEAFLKEYKDYDDAFKTDRTIAISLLGAFAAIYLIDGIIGCAKSFSQPQAFIVPSISPSGQPMARLSWTMNF